MTIEEKIELAKELVLKSVDRHFDNMLLEANADPDGFADMTVNDFVFQYTEFGLEEL